MHRNSRGLFVGCLLLLALMLIGCQSVQPEVESPERAQTTGAASVTAAVVVSETTIVTAVAAIPISATVTGTDANAQSPTAEATSQAPNVVAADSELIAAGLSAYRAQYCGICHLLDAAETRGTFGPTHNLLGTTAAAYLADGTYIGGATTPAEYIRESIVDPQVFIVPGYATTSHRMPSYAHLDATTLDALVAFLLAQ